MKAKRLFIDTETFSECDIKKCGSYRYAEDPSTEIMICTYAFDDEKVQTWDCTASSKMPHDLRRALRHAQKGKIKVVGANFLLFDRLVIKHCWGIDIPVNAIEDTMIQAFRHALPGSLDMQCQVLQIDDAQAKDKAGKALINRFCKPTPKNYKVRRYTSETHPEDWKRFLNYARKDVEAMREVYWAMPTWGNSEFEDRVLELDIKINDRGFYVDTALANAAIAAVTAHKKELQQTALSKHGSDDEQKNQKSLLTGASFLPTLRELAPAHQVPNAQKSTLNGLLDDEDLPDEARELIEMRLGASSTASTKYHPLLRGLSKDGRRRGCLQYGGAKRTLRWAGRGFQPQNLARGYYHDDEDKGVFELTNGINRMLNDYRRFGGARFPSTERRFDVSKLSATTVRSCVVPSPGNKFVVADYSNVEGRGLAWLAGEETALAVFRSGRDIYCETAGRMFNMDGNYIKHNRKDLRAIGKVCELGLGYGGGVAAFLQFAKVYALNLAEMAEIMDGTFPDHIWKAALKGYEWARIQEKNKRAPKGQKAERPSYDLPKKVWLTCDSIKRMWRESHPKTQQFWRDLEEAAINAIRNPGKDYWAGARVRTDGNRAIKITRPLDGKNPSWWLKVELPSGRILSYPGIGLSVEIEIDEDSGKENKRTRIKYQGENQTTRQWQTLYTYGGKTAENVCQALCRDLLAFAQFKVEEKYPIVLHVHDENVTETPDTDEYSSDELEALMCTLPDWAQGFPLAAEGACMKRYAK